MAVKFSETVRNARVDIIESTIGASAVLKIRSGAPPANISDADSGAVLAVLNLPADWMNTGSSGQVSLLGTWQDTDADSTGTQDAGHFRLYANDGTTQHMQGTVTATGGGGDMTLDNISIAPGQTVTVTTFNITDGNA